MIEVATDTRQLIRDLNRWIGHFKEGGRFHQLHARGVLQEAMEQHVQELLKMLRAALRNSPCVFCNVEVLKKIFMAQIVVEYEVSVFEDTFVWKKVISSYNTLDIADRKKLFLWTVKICEDYRDPWVVEELWKCLKPRIQKPMSEMVPWVTEVLCGPDGFATARGGLTILVKHMR